MGTTIDLIGKKFNRLTVISREGRSPSNKIMWKCLCDCGKILDIIGASLKNGNTKSCGCLNDENRLINNLKHGKSKTKMYKSWSDMKSRCLNKNNKNYSRYGGRGISVCNEWLKFEPFMKWAIANNYDESLEIERRNNNKNYEPSNCKWATRKEQNNNTSRSIKNRFTKDELEDIKKCSLTYEEMKTKFKVSKYIIKRIKDGYYD